MILYYFIKDSPGGAIIDENMNQAMTASGSTSTYTITGLQENNEIEYWFVQSGVGDFPPGDTAHKFHTHSSSGGSTPTDGSGGSTPTDGGGGSGGTQFLLEAENYSTMNNLGIVTNQHLGFEGSGFADYWSSSSWLEWSGLSYAAADYTVTIRYGNGASRPVKVVINGDTTGATRFDLAVQGSQNWGDWVEETKTISISSSINSIRIIPDNNGGPNLDNIEFIPVGGSTPTDGGGGSTPTDGGGGSTPTDGSSGGGSGGGGYIDQSGNGNEFFEAIGGGYFTFLGGNQQVGGANISVPSIPKTAPQFFYAQSPIEPSNFWRADTFPKPANRWWDNMVIDRTAGDWGIGQRYGVESKFASHPYSLLGLVDGLEVSYPRIMERYEDRRGQNILVELMAIHEANMFIGAQGGFAGTDRKLIYADDFTFQMEWKNGTKTMNTYITRGAPYLTVKYAGGITPEITTIHAVLNVNGSAFPGGTTQTYSGNKFKFELNSGQTWILYSSSSVTIEVDATGSQPVIRTTSSFTGTMQLALATDANMESKLDTYKLTYVTSGEASYNVSGNNATINFNFQTNNGQNPLLMGLPHHADSGLNASFSLSTPYNTLKGDMIPVVGKTWTLTESLPTTTFYSARGVDTARIPAISAQLQLDKNLRPDHETDNPYYYGKQVARLGRLALIAEQIGEISTKNEIITTMQSDLDLWISGSNDNPLKYDYVWGSLATQNSIADTGQDFGIAEHNDLHFHFGYFVDAFAVIARDAYKTNNSAKIAWVNDRKNWIYTLIRAFANPHRDDDYFPQLRHKDWYMGHSWASGIVAFNDGNNMESTSESVNAYYSLMLLGEALGDTALYQFGQVMTATEIRSAQKYWQMKSWDNSVYPADFTSNKSVGIVWDTKVTYATWFGDYVEYIHGIQMIPFTPLSETLLPQDWIAEEYPVLEVGLTEVRDVQGNMETIEPAWANYIYMAQAILPGQKNAAWNNIFNHNYVDGQYRDTVTRMVWSWERQPDPGLVSKTFDYYDNGTSKTHALYWVATRPGSEPTTGQNMD